MSCTEPNIIADAATLQRLDSFTGRGWLKVIAPAKVNLFLGIGGRRADGYHDAISVLHALNLHDLVYLRRTPAPAGTGLTVEVEMFGRGDVEAPDVPLESNIITRAIRALAAATNCEAGETVTVPNCEAGESAAATNGTTGEAVAASNRTASEAIAAPNRTADEIISVHVEKNIPAQAGLGGGSSDAAATIVGMCKLWGIDPHTPAVDAVARSLGSDVAFFLYGGCGYFLGTGDTFVRSLDPMKSPVVLVKPAEGVSTKLAYEAFDASPTPVPHELAEQIEAAQDAASVPVYNNLAPASEKVLAQLADIRQWLEGCEGVHDVLLCGSGSTTFATCETHDAASRIVVEARKRGLWARATSFGSVRALIVGNEGGMQ